MDSDTYTDTDTNMDLDTGTDTAHIHGHKHGAWLLEYSDFSFFNFLVPLPIGG
jgi:hypothetical protein